MTKGQSKAAKRRRIRHVEARTDVAGRGRMLGSSARSGRVSFRAYVGRLAAVDYRDVMTMIGDRADAISDLREATDRDLRAIERPGFFQSLVTR